MLSNCFLFWVCCVRDWLLPGQLDEALNPRFKIRIIGLITYLLSR